MKIEQYNGNRFAYMSYFLLADESEEVISAYIEEGDCWSVQEKAEIIGTALVIPLSTTEVELKNIAVIPSYRGQGVGKRLIQTLCEAYKEKGYTTMTVGTANSSIENLIFYQKLGFRMDTIRKGFFDSYPNPIHEHGIQARDMIVFQKQL